MPQPLFGDVLAFLRKTSAVYRARDLSDGELLELFLIEREQAAFTVLVQRHGPMVLGVGQRLLGDVHAAEDVFQATFLVLIRRAASLRRDEPLGGWLHNVAQRLARKAQARAAQQRHVERRFAAMPRPEPLDDVTWQELRHALDEAIGALPKKYRAAIVLCYLQDKSYDQAAKELGWPKSSLASRLGSARELLRQQLVRRGITLSAAALTTALCEKVSAAPVTAFLTINTVKAATSLAAGKAVAGGCLSAGAIALAEEAMVGLVGIKVKFLVLVLAMGLALGGAGAAGYWGFAEKQEPARAAKVQPPVPGTKLPAQQKKQPSIIRTDLYGDPLPDWAKARLGTLRFRHGEDTRDVAFSPDGRILASIGSQTNLCLWDAMTGQPLHKLNLGMGGQSMAFSPDGKSFFSGSLRLIDVGTGKELQRFRGPPNRRLESPSYLHVAFSPDGKTVAAAENGGPEKPAGVVCWDVVTGKVQHTLDGHSGMVCRIAFSPDGKTLVSGSVDKTVRLWDLATGKQLYQLKAYGAAFSVAFAPNGKAVAGAGEDGIRIWDVKTGKLAQRLLSEESSVYTVAYSSDGKTLASAGQSGMIRIWDAELETELRRWQAHAASVQNVAFSPIGKVLASVGGQDNIRRWEPITGKEINPVGAHTGPVHTMVFAADGKTLFSCGFDRKVLEWDLATSKELGRTFSGPLGPKNWMWTAAELSPEGKTLALAGYSVPEYTWDPVIHLVDSLSGKENSLLSGHSGWVSSLAFSLDGKWLASQGKDGIRVWDLVTGKSVSHMPGHQIGQSSDASWKTLAFSADGKVLASAGLDKTIRIWEVASGKELRHWDSGEEVQNLIVSPDGKLVASHDFFSQSGIHVWAADTGKELTRFGNKPYENDLHPSSFWSMSFSPSGRLLAAGRSASRTGPGGFEHRGPIHLWEVYSGQEIRQFDASPGRVTALVFTPDGRTLASNCGDSTILLWDLTGQATQQSP